MGKKSNCLTLMLLIVFLIACNDPGKSKQVADSSSVTGAEWKTGIALYSFHRHPFTTALAMADSAGVKYIEGFSFYKVGAAFNDSTMGTMDKEGVTKMKQMLNEKGIKMLSMYVEGAKNAAGWVKYFEMGKEFGMKYLVCEPPKDQWNMIDSLAGLYNMKIAIHEHSKELSAYWHPDSVLAAIKGHKNIGACADLGHWVRSGLDPVKCLKQLNGNIIGIHLKDIDELNNPDAKDVNPGTGVIDFVAVVKELKRQGFNGVIDIECEHNLDNNLADVKEAIRYINELTQRK